MKVIIAGSRGITQLSTVLRAVAQSSFGEHITEVVSGTAPGVDRLGEEFARTHETRRIEVKRFPADWDRLGKSAGFRRNEEMARYADALIAIWDGQSRGTAHMIEYMRKLGKPVHVMQVHLP